MVEALTSYEGEMVQAQGSQPFDAYRTLQLRPSAPHDLVERAYWALVARARRQASSSVRLGELNDAYATLINPDRRLAYDAEQGFLGVRQRPLVSVRRNGLFSKRVHVTTKLDHYQLLHLDREAASDIVDVAYTFRRSQLMGSDMRIALERGLVDAAYATLSNPQRRAQYDERLKRTPRHRAAAPPRPAAPAAPAQARKGGEAEAAVTAYEPSPAEASAVVDAPETAVAPEFVAPPHEPAGASAAPAADSEFAAEAPAMAPGRRWPFGRKADDHVPRERRPSQREVRAEEIAAERRRLLELGLSRDAVTFEGEAAHAPEAEALPNARFRFVAGPQAGRIAGLGEGSLIFGASDSADVILENPDGMIGAGHVRVWHRDRDYMLHQLDTFSTTFINDERLDLRLVILEPGDEMRIGQHVLVFERTAEPEPHEQPAAVVADGGAGAAPSLDAPGDEA